MSLQTVDRIGPFQVLGTLGRGSFGTVYKVAGPDQQALALKWLSGMDPDDPDQRLRFQREVEIASTLRHPHLLRILEWGDWEGRPYCTMEVVEGTDLRKVIDGRPPGPPGAAWRQRVHDLGTPLFAAIQHLHNHNIVHRDIKPDNVFVAVDSRPVLGDFGLAVRDTVDTHRSRVGTLSGTIAYMAPEVLTGHEADRRSDMFSLGVLLLEFITGRLPYDTQDTGSILTALLSDGVQPLRDLFPGCPPSLDYVLGRLTAQSPEDRYFTVAEACYDWIDALGSWLETAPEPITLEVDPSSCTLMQSSFRGRAQALDDLEAARHRAATTLAAVVVRGEAGIGKSRLVAEWRRRLPPGPTWALTFDDPEGPALGPWMRLLEDVLASLAADAVVPDLELIRQMLSAHRRGFDDRAPAPTPTRAPEEGGDLERWRLHSAIRSLLEAAVRPSLVLILEDLHNADPESLRLLLHCLSHWQGGPWSVLVVATSRGASTALEEITLGPLSTVEQEELVRSLLGAESRPLPAELFAAMARDASGNPSAIKEIVSSLLHAAVLRPRRGFWEWSPAAYQSWYDDLGEGDRLERVLLHALQSLPREAQTMVSALALASAPTRLDELASVVELQPALLFRYLCMLLERGLVRENRGRCVLRRRVLPVAQGRLDEGARVALHRQWARVLEAAVQSGADSNFDLVSRLVEHRAASGELLPVARVLLQMAERSVAAGGHEQALRTYQRVLGSPRVDSVFSPAELWELRVRETELAELAGHFSQAMDLLKELLTLSGEGRPRLLDRLARCHFGMGDHQGAVLYWVILLRELGLPMPVGVPAVAAVARAALGTLVRGLEQSMLKGNPENAEAIMSACGGLMKADYFMRDRQHRVFVLYALLAIVQMARVTRQATHLVHANTLLVVLFSTRLPWNQRRVWHRQEALRYLADCDPGVRMEARWSLAFFDLLAGDVDNGVELARAAAVEARLTGNTSGRCYALSVLCSGLAMAGDVAGLADCVREVEPILPLLGDARLSAGFRNHELVLRFLTCQLDLPERLTAPLSQPDLSFDAMGHMRGMGAILVIQGRFLEAAGLLEESLGEAWRLRSGAYLTVMTVFWLAQALLRHLADRPQVGRSRARRKRLSELARGVQQWSRHHPRLQGLVLAVQAGWLGEQGRVEAALQLYDRSVAVLEQATMRPMALFVGEAAARVAHGRGIAGRGQPAVQAWAAAGLPRHAERLRQELMLPAIDMADSA